MSCTANNMIQAVGHVVQVKVEKWFIPMTVLDAKSAYGVPRVLVTPVSGEGEAWVDLSRLKMSSTTEVAVI